MLPIRRATSDDIDQLLRLRLLLFQETGEASRQAPVQEIISFAKSTSIRRLWLHATASGRPIYEKAGFVTTLAEMELTW
jgi:hypothetical protein